MTVNPFVEYREILDVYAYALDVGLCDADYVSLADATNAKIRESSGVGFTVTPLELVNLAGSKLWAKVETGNVGGSHKARHLFGLALRAAIDDAAGTAAMGASELVIASCGNAALGAGVVANALGLPLRVFVPTDANPTIIDQLSAMHATVEECPRIEGRQGDPCFSAMTDAVASGAVAFTVQGPVQPYSIDGCRTLGAELAHQLHDRGVTPSDIFIQVGGGALGTAVMDGFRRSGLMLPRLHTVQPTQAHPFVATVRALMPLAPPPGDYEAAAHFVDEHHDAMEPWPGTPSSVAYGILDDVTYDWKTLLVHQIATGGGSLTVSEETFVRVAGELEPQITPAPDETGAAGAAGFVTAVETGASFEEPVVLLTGMRR